MSELPRERGTKEKVAEDPVVTVAKALAPQMGSDPKHLSQQEIDQRKFAVLNEYTQAALGYFAWRGQKLNRTKIVEEQNGDEVKRKVVKHDSFWTRMVDWELSTTPSINGLGRRQVIQTVAAAAGVGKGVLDVAEKPNIIARHTTQRDWKEKATREGKVITE